MARLMTRHSCRISLFRRAFLGEARESKEVVVMGTTTRVIC